MGEGPDWYRYFVEADRLRMPVMEMPNVPVWWRDKAMIANSAEIQARKAKAAQHGG